MKYCPYCGAPITGTAVSFCSECGKHVNHPPKESRPQTDKASRALKESDHGTRAIRPSPEKSQPGKKKSGSSTRAESRSKRTGVSQNRKMRPEGRNPGLPNGAKTSARPARNPADANYDGYYDDVPTADNGHNKEKLEPELIKRIAFVSAGAFVVVILSIVVMYLL